MLRDAGGKRRDTDGSGRLMDDAKRRGARCVDPPRRLNKLIAQAGCGSVHGVEASRTESGVGGCGFEA